MSKFFKKESKMTEEINPHLVKLLSGVHHVEVWAKGPLDLNRLSFAGRWHTFCLRFGINSKSELAAAAALSSAKDGIIVQPIEPAMIPSPNQHVATFIYNE
jgi:hypothetical protein